MNVVDWTPDRRRLRQFAALLLVLALVLLAARLYHGPAIGAAGWVALVITVGGVLGTAWPTVMRVPYLAAMIATFPIGWVVSRVLVAIAFFAVLTPIAVMARLMGRDVLRRRRPTVDSYWEDFPQPTGRASYYQQS